MLDFDALGIKGSKKNLAWLMTVAALAHLGLFPLQALRGSRTPRSAAGGGGGDDRGGPRFASAGQLSA